MALVIASAAIITWLAARVDDLDGDEIGRQIANRDGLGDTGYEQYVRKVPQTHVETDRGNPVPLCTYIGDAEVTERYRRLGTALEAKFANSIIRVGDQDPTYSCHGWTFAAGHYHMLGSSVDQILSDNGYRQVVRPQAGDVIIYRDATGKILHSGIVRTADDHGLVLIESKWSVLGRYLHAPDVQVYSQQFSYYRSPRHGHTLAGLRKIEPSQAATRLDLPPHEATGGD